MNFIKMQLLSIFLILSFLTIQSKAEVIDRIEAHVGNRIITSYDIETLNPDAYKAILAIPDEKVRQEQMAQYKEQALNFLIDMNIMEIAAEKDGIKISDKDLERAINEIAASNNLSMADFEKTLKSQNLSLKQYKYQIKSQMILRSKINVPQIVITEEDILNMVDEKQDEFGLKDLYDISIITVQTKSEINQIISRLKKGASFEDEAKKYSLDTSASNGGALGFQNATYMPIEMEETLKKTKVGSLTKPFKYEDKWAVCLVKAFKSKYEIDDATRQKIREAIGEKLFAEAVEKWMKKSRESVVVLRANEKFKVK